ncbi:MAG: glycine/sarcosine/betaine reductase component B subunit [SAR202 cluster bacterium]|nr:glycine/sarcosine/betaine reductase component B subunit [SAR202 cluster bacterium]
MRLEMGTFPVTDIVFGSQTRWNDGVLEVNEAEILEAVRADRRIAKVELELAKPGESVRIWPARDVVEPRVKVEGPGVTYPGICGRPITTVGQGRTHRMSGIGIVEVSETPWHESGGDHLFVYLDMTGPWADVMPYSSLNNLCVVVEPDPGLGVDARNEAVHAAVLTVSDMLAATTVDLDPPELETFDLSITDPSLPGVVYVQCLHSPQAMSGSPNTFCTSTYGLTQLTPPWLFHPNEILDGAITGPYRTAFATSWTVANNPALIETYRRHGKDFNFLGIIATRTEWTTQHEKQLTANQTAKMAQMLGASGALVTWDAGGNEFIEVIRTVQACENVGIKTVFLTSEDDPTGDVPTMLEPVPEADAIVSTGFYNSALLDIDPVPGVSRVIGQPQKVTGRLRDQLLPTAGPLPPPQRLDDHYGFGRLSGIER